MTGALLQPRRRAAGTRAQAGSAGLAQAAAALHVTNGDSTVRGLREAGVRGEVLAWRDVLHEGPVPRLAPAALARVRAQFLAEATGIQAGRIFRDLRDRDRRLAAASGEVVLWFEADLYDQLQLIQVLERLGRGPARELTLVAVGEYPGVAHFGGLGELSGPDLAGLLRTAATGVDAAALELSRRAWAAFTSPDPGGLVELSGVHSPVLRHLGEALQRLLQEYPWVDDGLSLTERRLLQAIARGAGTPAEVFRELWRLERRPFLGDVWCFRTLALLVAEGLVEGLVEGPVGEGGRLALSARGEEVLAGRADRLRQGGLDRWIGGVRLGSAPSWRWDPRLEVLREG